jgi:pyruvate carboxylase
VAATDHTERTTGLSLDALGDLEPYWEAVRTLYAPFESGLRAPTGRVYEHEIPGGQLSNLRQQAGELGLGNRFPEIERLYARCNALLGNIVKVTPTSKVVGDLALYLASTGLDPEELAGDPARYDLPASVLGFLRGDLGVPPAGWPAFRDRALKGRETPEPEVELTLAERDTLDNGQGTERRALLNRVLFPGPAKEQEEAVFKYGDVSVLPTPLFLYGLQPGTEIEVELEPGVTLLLELEAVAEPDARGQRTVLCRVNGQTRPVEAEDRSVERHDVQVEKADPNNPGHVAAPLTGVVNLLVSQGDAVTAGQRIGTIEAMKMESAISAPKDGVVSRVALTGTQVEPGDLLLVLEDGPGGSGVPRS